MNNQGVNIYALANATNRKIRRIFYNIDQKDPWKGKIRMIELHGNQEDWSKEPVPYQEAIQRMQAEVAHKVGEGKNETK